MAREEDKLEGSTRERLLNAAMDIFGMQGYEAATTREIARLGQVNIAAIPYYYQGKEGLYQAVIDRVVEVITGRVGAFHQRIAEESFDGPQGRVKAMTMLEEFITAVVNTMIGSSFGPPLARILLREQLFPTASYKRILTGFMAPMLDSMARLITVITGDSSYRRVHLRAVALLGQIISFRVGREVLVRSLKMEGYIEEEVAEIREVILEQTRNSFSSYLQ